MESFPPQDPVEFRVSLPYTNSPGKTSLWKSTCKCRGRGNGKFREWERERVLRLGTALEGHASMRSHRKIAVAAGGQLTYKESTAYQKGRPLAAGKLAGHEGGGNHRKGIISSLIFS